MADKTYGERIWDLEDKVKSLEDRIRVLEAVTKTSPETVLEPKKRGNPNWVKK